MNFGWKSMPYVAGGIGLAALENKLVGDNLPSSLKNVNYFLGGTTGALLGSGNPEAQIAGLSSIPLKQGLLFGVGGLDKFREQQQNLTDTNLNTAKINQSAAALHLRDAGSARAVQLAFLIPALVGAGALGYEAIDKYRKGHKGDPKFKNMAEGGNRKSNQKLRLEMPVSALPADFASSLLSAGDRSHFTVKEREEPADVLSPRKRRKSASWLGNVGNAALTFTGIPNLLRGGKDLMYGFGSLQDGNYKDTARYAGAGLGNLALGVAGARWGSELGARLVGKARLQGVIRNAMKGESSQLTEAPTAARFLYRHGFLGGAGTHERTSLTGGTLPAVNAFDPARYAWKNPTTESSIFKRLLTAPGIEEGPRSIPGAAMLGARYAGNRAVNAGHGLSQLMRRYPNLSLTALGAPFANRGTIRDEEQSEQEKSMWDKYLPQTGNTGPMGMPVSSVANSIIRAMSGSPEPIARQLSGR